MIIHLFLLRAAGADANWGFYFIRDNAQHELCFAFFHPLFLLIFFSFLFYRRGEGQLQVANWMTKDVRC